MLKQFNPDNINYGAWIEEKRREFIENRIRNSYFLYSLCATLALVVLTAVCVKWRVDHRRAMWITAEMMADLYNQDSYSRQIAHETIDRYNKHIERCNRAVEDEEAGIATVGGNEIEQLRTELMRVAEERDTAIRDRDIAREDLRRKAAILADMSVRLGGSKSGPTSVAKANSDVASANANLVTHINNLQEQLYAERNHNRRLRGG
jgi:hypothetical protein